MYIQVYEGEYPATGIYITRDDNDAAAGDDGDDDAGDDGDDDDDAGDDFTNVVIKTFNKESISSSLKYSPHTLHINI